MNKIVASLLAGLVYATIAVGLFLVILLLFAAGEQCPDYFTPAQIQGTGCVAGANIGLGLLLLATPIMWLIGASVAYLVMSGRKQKHPRLKKKSKSKS